MYNLNNKINISVYLHQFSMRLSTTHIIQYYARKHFCYTTNTALTHPTDTSATSQLSPTEPHWAKLSVVQRCCCCWCLLVPNSLTCATLTPNSSTMQTIVLHVASGHYHYFTCTNSGKQTFNNSRNCVNSKNTVEKILFNIYLVMSQMNWYVKVHTYICMLCCVNFVLVSKEITQQLFNILLILVILHRIIFININYK